MLRELKRLRLRILQEAEAAYCREARKLVDPSNTLSFASAASASQGEAKQEAARLSPCARFVRSLKAVGCWSRL